MNEEKKTLRMAVASWAVPVLTLVALGAVTAAFPVGSQKDIRVVLVYGVAYSVLLIGGMAVSLALAVAARARSRRLHGGKYRRHATAGLLVSLPLLVVYCGAFIWMLLDLLSYRR